MIHIKRNQTAIYTHDAIRNPIKAIYVANKKPYVLAFVLSTVYSGNSKRLNSEQSLISEHFW